MQEEKMPTLQVRDLPDDVYIGLTLLAKEENRSVTQQTIVLLKQGLNLHRNNQLRRAALLEKIVQIKYPSSEHIDTAALIREDRDR